MLTPLAAMVRKDLQLFFSDRRAVIMSFVVPIAIASFFGSVFSGPSSRSEPAKIAVAVVDQDGSSISRAIVASLRGDRNFTVSSPSADDARAAVRRGTTSVAVIIPPGFGDASARAFFGDALRPALDLAYDPSHATELAVVRGILTEHVMESVSREALGGAQGRAAVARALGDIDSWNVSPGERQALRGMLESVQRLYGAEQANGTAAAARPGLRMPYTVREQAMTAGVNVAYNGYAHAFGGMGVQFLLFAAANLGIDVLLERQRGLWKRLRSAPVSRAALLTGKTISGTIISLMTLLVSFAFAIVVFRVRIQGSLLGFFGVSLACAVMAATFGLLIAALGRTPASARGVTTFAVLIMVMLGGAWVPTFIFPAWLQRLTLVVPARWAVDGLDAMTWRGLGAASAIAPIVVQLAFAALFGAIAAVRFRWEEG